MSFRRALIAVASLLAFLPFTSLLSGCGSSQSESPTTPADVYVAGGSADTVGYWKNGTYVRLSTEAGEAYGIAIANGHVYVAGQLGTQAALWVDGQLTVLPGAAFENSANAVAVSGADVYVGGFTQNNGNGSVPVIWKNGVASVLTEGITGAPANETVQAGGVGQIIVAAGNVYASGTQEIYDLTAPNTYTVLQTATLWTNGTPATLTNYPASSEVFSLDISGSSVYMGGFILPQQALGTEYIPTIWNNGVVASPALGDGGIVISLAVNGSNVYAEGYLNNIFTVWNNSQVQFATNNMTTAGGMALYGSDVYAGAVIAGSDSQGDNIYAPGYYLNGTWTALPDSDPLQGAAVNAIVAVPQGSAAD